MTGNGNAGSHSAYLGRIRAKLKGIDLSETNSLAKIPENLWVDGSLDLRAVRLASLPDDLTVEGILDLSGRN